MDIDLVRLNINDTSITILKVIISLLMFAIALELKFNDFKTMINKPKALLVGIFLQCLLFPLLTVLFIHLFELRASLALGLIMITASPIGNLANLLTTLARGNLALSVSLTSVTNLLSLITTPLYIFYLSNMNVNTSQYLKTIQLDQQEILQGVFVILGIPVFIGMLTSTYYPKIATKIQEKAKKISSAFLLLFILSALAANFSYFLQHMGQVFSITFSYHLIIIFACVLIAQVMKISMTFFKSLLITSIMKNTGLALSLTLQFFPSLGGMAILVAFATISQIASGFIIVKFLNYKSNFFLKWNKW